jgi:hypothetical protein
MHEKGSHFIKKCRFLEVFQVPVKQMLLGDIFPNGFSPRSLWCLEKIQGPIWRSKDHLVMKGLSKNVKNHEFSRTHYSVRQKIEDAGSISTQNIFPLHSVTPKRLESPYGANYFVFAENPVFHIFSY